MKDSKTLLEERASIVEEMDKIVVSCEKEERSMNDEETNKFNELDAKATALKAEAERAVKIENMRAEMASNVTTEESKIKKDFSYLRAIEGFINGNMDGIEAEMHQEAKNEARSMGRTINGVGIPNMILESRANVVTNGTAGVDTQSFAASLQGESILANLGATFFTGLQNDVRIPVMGATTVAWEGETDATADGGQALSKLDLSPTRIATKVNLSKQLIAQHNESVEAAFVNDIARAVATKIDGAVFSNTAGAPTWIGDGKTAIDKTDIVDLMLALEEEVAGNKGLSGNLGYAISHKLMAEVKKGAKVSQIASLYADGQLNGYPAYFSPFIGDPSLNEEGVFFGDWSQLVVAQFGGLDITIDPYTLADQGMVRLVLNSYHDFGLKQAGAISIGEFSGTNA